MSAKRRPDLLDESTYPEPGTINDATGDRVFDFYLDISAVGPKETGESAGGHLSNTAPTTLQIESTEILEKPQEHGGYDTLEILIHGQWEQERFDRLVEMLEQAQQKARGMGDGTETLTEIGGEEVKVWSSGVRRGVYCSWCFT